jgi:hypothetical protein
VGGGRGILLLKMNDYEEIEDLKNPHIVHSKFNYIPKVFTK